MDETEEELKREAANNAVLLAAGGLGGGAGLQPPGGGLVPPNPPNPPNLPQQLQLLPRAKIQNICVDNLDYCHKVATDTAHFPDYDPADDINLKCSKLDGPISEYLSPAGLCQNVLVVALQRCCQDNGRGKLDADGNQIGILRVIDAYGHWMVMDYTQAQYDKERNQIGMDFADR
jgi:hypothetical protein